MNKCPYCMEPVADCARKCPHCHSFLDKTAEPKRAAEAADLVIKFVGYGLIVFSTLAALILGGAGLLGYRSLNDLEKSLTSRFTELESSVTKQFKEIESDAKQSRDRIADTEAKVNELLKSATQTVTSTAVDYMYTRYRQLFDSLVLDELADEDLAELNDLHERAATLRARVPENYRNDKLVEIEKVIHSVLDYRNRDYNHGIEDISVVSDDSAAKHRMLISLYAQRFKSYLQSGAKERAKSDLEAMKRSASRYYEMNAAKSALANTLRGVSSMMEALYFSNDETERASRYLEATKYFQQAKKINPRARIVDYNLAACYSRLNRFADALRELETAKTRGEFATSEQVDFFDKDPDFAGLREAAKNDPKIQEGLARIRAIST